MDIPGAGSGAKSGQTLKLRKFDISSIKTTHTVVLLGKRNTGKSFLIRDMMYYHRDVPLGTVICPTEPVNPFFRNFVPSIFIHDTYSPDTVNNVLKRQKKVKANVDRNMCAYGSCNIDPRMFLIMDDCAADSKSWARSREIRELFMNGRHSNLLVLITLQYPMGIPPELRSNIDYTFILRENVLANRKRIYDNYAGIFPSFDMFCEVLNQCTNDFEMLVIANNANSTRLTDCVFWYKAAPVRNYNMCAPEYWELAERMRREEAEAAGDGDDDEDGMFDASSMRKKNAPMVFVKKTV